MQFLLLITKADFFFHIRIITMYVGFYYLIHSIGIKSIFLYFRYALNVRRSFAVVHVKISNTIVIRYVYVSTLYVSNAAWAFLKQGLRNLASMNWMVLVLVLTNMFTILIDPPQTLSFLCSRDLFFDKKMSWDITCCS